MKTRCFFHVPLLASTLWTVLLPGQLCGAVVYVKTNGNDALAGTDWALAKQTLNAAMSVAVTNDAIWVARGTYFENVTFKPGLTLYGGFNGTETDLAERNWATNITAVFSTNGPVVTITNADRQTRLDGFTITGGIGIHGGGIKTIGAAPVIANNTIRNNITDGAGAGISVWYFYIQSSTNIQFPLITNNTIVENQAINDEGDGAGIAVVSSSPLIAWNVIARNTATRNGGGIACWRHSLPVIANNFILANSATYDELTVSLGGGAIFASATDFDGRPIPGAVSAPVIINNVLAANGGNFGGGISVVDSELGAATIANNTVVANNGAGVFWANTWPTNDNNIVAFNTRGFARGIAGTSDAEIRFNNVYGNGVLGSGSNYRGTADRTGLAGNLSADPKFANFAIGDFHVQADSPCVDASSAALAPTNWVDIDGEARVQGNAVDIGADESTGATWNIPTPVVRVSAAGDDSDGSTWAKAKQTVAGGIATAATTGGEVWVAQGTYSGQIKPPAFVWLYGGFAGDESNRAQRNPAAHPTILDGGGVAPVVYYRNAGYKISALDGFTVQGGGIYTGGNVFHPDLTNRFGGRGGGVYCRVSGPVIANNLIRSNSLGSPFNVWESFGGGIYCYLSHAEIAGNTFTENEVLTRGDGNGGGLYCFQSLANIEGNHFHHNHALDGAAIYGNWSELRVVRNLVQTNAFYTNAPSVYMGSGNGAMTFLFATDLLLEANTIQGNVANFGAGVCLLSPYAARVQNNVIVDNLAWDYSGFGSGGQGGGLSCSLYGNATGMVVVANNSIVGNNAPPTILGHFGGGLAVTLNTNCLLLANNLIASNSSGIWRYPYFTNQPVLQHNCVINSNTNYVNLSAGTGDFSLDPQFVNRAAGNFHLLAASPCIDAGTNSVAPLADFDGVNRPLDGNANGSAAWDVGAFEFVHPTADTDGDGAGDAAEVVAGTDATRAASVLKLTCRLNAAPTGVTVSWPTVGGRRYRLEARSPITGANTWETLTNEIPGSGAVFEYLDAPLAGSNRFFRVQVSRP